MCKLYSTIEQVKTGMFVSVKYAHGCQVPHVLVFSNTLPDFAQLTSDRWRLFRITSKKELFAVTKVFGNCDGVKHLSP